MEFTTINGLLMAISTSIIIVSYQKLNKVTVLSILSLNSSLTTSCVSDDVFTTEITLNLLNFELGGRVSST